jgi:large subunit ribosomal protein L30
MTNVAVIRIRGAAGIRKDMKDTLTMLNLHNKNNCVVLTKQPNVIGMINKVKDFVTWGEISDETIALLKKRDKGKKFFTLNNPKGGFERKGIKYPFSIGGVLGYRGDKINDLIKRMI